jgi:tetratricopeptide (TPR) repeat protein
MMSLANTLVEIGQRENNVHYFEEAITLLGRVSEERSRSEDDIRWARARVNMGSALLELGKRTSGRNGLLRLREARAAFEDAATVRSDQATPTDWARARRFEGEAHLYIGLRERTTESLERAVAAFDEALALFDRRETPHDWARTSALKGRALATLAVRKPTASGASTAASHLEAAIEILEAAGYVHEIEELRPQLMAAHAYAERLAAR